MFTFSTAPAVCAPATAGAAAAAAAGACGGGALGAAWALHERLTMWKKEALVMWAVYTIDTFNPTF
jgi:hypothetical protein